jgi:hypothetical protein
MGKGMLPLLVILLLGQTNVLGPDVYEMLTVSGILTVADVALSLVARATFQREEMLTKWK